MPARKKQIRKSTKTRPKKTRDEVFKQVDAYRVKPEPFPRVMLTRCKFTDSFALTQGIANTAVSKTYRMTDIYDPEHAVGGLTVAGHTQLASIYSRYQVMGAKVIISFNAPQASGARIGYRIRIGGANATSGSSLEDLSSQPMTYLDGLNSTGSQTRTFYANIMPWTVHGISKLEYLANSSQYTSGISAGPLNRDLALLDVFICDSISGNSVRVLTKIVYYVKFYARVPLLMSAL